MTTPWIKLCGLTRPADAELALALGARYLGCVLVPSSPRVATLDQARALAGLAGPRLVAVVRDLSPDALDSLLATVRPGVLQLHGEEPPAELRRLRSLHPQVMLWKALSVPPVLEPDSTELEPLLQIAQAYLAAGAEALLLDTRTPTGTGGTGLTCDWDAAAGLARQLESRVILAGGLTPENVAEAAERVRPLGLDVSSGVEEAPGLKSAVRLRALFAALRPLP